MFIQTATLTARTRELLLSVLSKGLRRNSFFSFMQAIVGFFSILVTYKLLIATSGTVALGQWSLVLGLTTFARIADISGGGALARLVAIASKDKMPAIIDTATGLVGILYLVLIFIVFLPTSYLIQRIVSVQEGDIVQALLPWGFAVLYFSTLATTQLSALDGIHRADLRAKLAILSYLVGMLTAAILIPDFGAIGLAASQVTQHIFSVVGSRIVLNWHLPNSKFIPKHFTREALLGSLAYGGRLQLFNLASLIYDPVIRLTVNHFAGTSSLAVFEIGTKVVTQVRGLVVAASTPLISEFAQLSIQHNDRLMPLLKKANFVIVVASASLLSVVVLISPAISYALLGHIDTLLLITISALCIGYQFNSYSVAIYLYSQAIGRLRWNIAGQILIASLSVAVGSWIGFQFGGQFTVIGLAFAIASGSSVAIAGNARMHDISLVDIFNWKLIVVPLAIISVVTAITFILARALLTV